MGLVEGKGRREVKGGRKGMTRESTRKKGGGESREREIRRGYEERKGD